MSVRQPDGILALRPNFYFYLFLILLSFVLPSPRGEGGGARVADRALELRRFREKNFTGWTVSYVSACARAPHFPFPYRLPLPPHGPTVLPATPRIDRTPPPPPPRHCADGLLQGRVEQTEWREGRGRRKRALKSNRRRGHRGFIHRRYLKFFAANEIKKEKKRQRKEVTEKGKGKRKKESTAGKGQGVLCLRTCGRERGVECGAVRGMGWDGAGAAREESERYIRYLHRYIHHTCIHHSFIHTYIIHTYFHQVAGGSATVPWND